MKTKVDCNAVRKNLDIPKLQPGSSWSSVFQKAASVKLEDVDDDFLARTLTTATPLSELAELARINSVKQESTQPSLKKKRKLELQVATKPRSSDGHTSDNDGFQTKECQPNCDEHSKSKKKRKKDKKKKKKDKSASQVKESLAVPDDQENNAVNPNPILEGKMVPLPSNPEEQILVLLDQKSKKVYSAFKRTEEGEPIEIGTIDGTGQIQWQPQAFDDASSDNDTVDSGSQNVPSQFPFPVDEDDHCESPITAYQDILPLLEYLFPAKHKCKIYDPYYCDGAVKRNLASLGFPSVHNAKEDCYVVWASGKLPKMNVLITNPPYSQDHIPKLIDFLSSSAMDKTPWFLLMPQWVSKKPYFASKWDKKAFFLVPSKRYVYEPPKNFRERKQSDVHKKSSPFVSIWYVWGGNIETTEQLLDVSRQNKNDRNFEVARSKNGLRDLRRKK